MKIDQVYPGVAVIILDETKQQVLLQQRTDVKQWGIPSGHVEIGETVAQAAIREVWEEANVKIAIERLVGVYSEPASQVFHYPDGRVVHFITTCFLAKIVEGTIQADCKESLDMRFFPTDQLPTALLPMHPRWLQDALSETERAYIR